MPAKATSRIARIGSTVGKWLQRLLAAGLWVVFYWRLTGRQLPNGRGLAPFLDPVPWPPVLVLSLVTYAVLRGPLRLLGAVLYLTLLPVWAPFVAFYWLWRLFKAPFVLVNAGARTGRKLWSSVRLRVWSALALPVLFSIIVSSQEPWLFQSAATVLVVLALLLLAWTCTWVSSPASYLVRVGNRFLAWGVKHLEGFTVSDLPEKGDYTPEVDNRVAKTLSIMGDIETNLQRFAQTVLNPRAAVALFLATFLLAFSLLVGAFGAACLAAWKGNAASFSGSTRQPNLPDALFFSLTTVTTVGLSELRPVSGLAKGIVALELVSGLALVSLLALSFSTLHAADLEGAREIWEAASQNSRKRLEEWQGLLADLRACFSAGNTTALQAAYETARGRPAERWEAALRSTRTTALLNVGPSPQVDQ